ncbi:hypothetical protein R9C00_15425 [Flammeovirgaceae bacterium SG7u.111]|nr:hypothetical protein [Flammeovirgaceae bacterium SG7u.132]WPO33093.1 hypothetical protein R9C00_15425 [Flammeovirgaceae bacterium SG7u.111]
MSKAKAKKTLSLFACQAIGLKPHYLPMLMGMPVLNFMKLAIVCVKILRKVTLHWLLKTFLVF